MTIVRKPHARKRNQRKATALDHYKNYVRGNSDKFTAFTQARRSLPREFLPQLAAWGTKAFKYSFFRSQAPINLADLQPIRNESAGTFEEELYWCETLLGERRETIKSFIGLKAAFEKELLEGDVDRCLSLLDDIDREFGPSLWAVSLRITILQMLKGIEVQKQYINELKNLGRPFVSFLTYWWGVRAEEDTTLDRYSQRIQKQLRAADTSEFSAYFAFLLLGLVPAEGDERYLLMASTTSSIIDLYQIYSDLLVVAVAEDRSSAESFVKSALRLGVCVFDARLAKAVSLFNTWPDLAAIDHRGHLTFRDQMFARNNDEKAITFFAGSPVGLEELAAAATIGWQPTEPLNSFASKVFGLLSQLGQRGATGSRCSNELLKFGSNFDKLNLGYWCMSVALQAKSADAVLPSGLQKLRLLNTPHLEPFLLSYMPSAAQERFDAMLEVAYANTPTLLAARVASKRINTVDAKAAGVGDMFLAEANLLFAMERQDFAGAIEIARKTNADVSRANKLSLQSELSSLISLYRLEEALELSASWYLADRAIAEWLPLERLGAALKESPTSFDGNIAKPILYDALARIHGGEYNSLKAYATEDFVSSHGADRPSQLSIGSLSAPKEQLIYFLSEICTANILRLSVAYQTERELEDELLSICRVLAEIDPEKGEAYEERARELVSARSIKDALKELQGSKISIDGDALRAFLQKNMREDYDRYIALLKSGVAVVDDNYKKQLMKALASGEITASLFEVPDNEASALFAALVVAVIGELTYNAEHGLDCYLSLRIRHGTLSGQLRGSVEREHIVTRRDATTREYQANRYWAERLSSVDPADHGQILYWLAEFSREFDAIIFDLTDKRIQVFRKEKPDGLFHLHVTELTIYSLATEVKITTTFDEFLDYCVDTFWGLVDISLNRIRLHIDEVLRSSIRDQFDQLDAALQQMPSSEIVMLSDAIRRARTDTGIRVDTMRDWFVQPTPSSSVPFTVQELVDIALTTIKGFRPEFQPHVSIIAADDAPALTGALRLFSDIFFILFENISSYSGDSIHPRIDIAVDIKQDRMIIRVTNDIQSHIDTDHILKQIELARSRIDSGAYLSAVRSEGGTGLPKLAKLIKGTAERPPIEFGLSDDRLKFFVELELDVAFTVRELEGVA